MRGHFHREDLGQARSGHSITGRMDYWGVAWPGTAGQDLLLINSQHRIDMLVITVKSLHKYILYWVFCPKESEDNTGH